MILTFKISNMENFYSFKTLMYGESLDTGKNKDPNTWVFSFRTFNLNHSWILSQLSYEKVLYIKSFV